MAINEQRKRELIQIAQQIKAGKMNLPTETSQSSDGILPKKGILPGLVNALNFSIGRTSSPEGPKDINSEISTLMAKQAIENQDPYRQSQLKINNEIIKNLEGGQAGGDLIYRDQMTGQEVPQEQALKDISTGKQYIIKRRVASRQGIKEEDVSNPKELSKDEVITSSGAEEVLKEIDDLEKIIQSEPNEPGSTVPFIGKSAQAQGVKIPFVAPYGISEKGQEYRTLRESINNRLLYLRSGAQINKEEYTRLSGMLPEIFRSDKVDLQQLTRFKSEFGNILTRIQSGRRGISESSPKQPQSEYQVGQKVSKNGKTYTYLGNNQWEF